MIWLKEFYFGLYFEKDGFLSCHIFFLIDKLKIENTL